MCPLPTSTASSIDFTYRINPLFHRSGYDIWRLEMELVLTARHLKKYISPDENDALVPAEDAQAQLILYKHLFERTRLQFQRKKPKSARDLWNMLSEEFSDEEFTD